MTVFIRLILIPERVLSSFTLMELSPPTGGIISLENVESRSHYGSAWSSFLQHMWSDPTTLFCDISDVLDIHNIMQCGWLCASYLEFYRIGVNIRYNIVIGLHVYIHAWSFNNSPDTCRNVYVYIVLESSLGPYLFVGINWTCCTQDLKHRL